jgi:hypothetical protein
VRGEALGVRCSDRDDRGVCEAPSRLTPYASRDSKSRLPDSLNRLC